MRAIAELPCDGILGFLAGEGVRNFVLPLSAPKLNISSRYDNLPFPSILNDDVAVGRVAAEHFIDRGLKSLAFYGIPSHLYSQRRLEGFRSRAAEAGVSLSVYQNPPPGDRAWEPGNREKALGAWLAPLPRPLGVMACNDVFAMQILMACDVCKLLVPEQVAVLGVDDDEMICELASVPLSSVALAGERIGYEAAATLDVMMDGGHAPDHCVLLPPAGVVSRRSTDVLAVDDAGVVTALRFIREHVADGVKVSDVLRSIPVCRRALERRFRIAMGRTLHDEIHRTRLERAKSLLAETPLPIPEVCRGAGFRDPKRFTVLFHEAMGMAPIVYRKKFRVR